MVETTYRDHTGDKVYDYLKSHVLEGNVMVGAKIYPNPQMGPKAPKILIEIKVLTVSGKAQVYKYSYKKIERQIK